MIHLMPVSCISKRGNTMVSVRSLLFLALAISCLATGCSDDPVSPGAKSPTVITADIPWVATAFTAVAEQAQQPLQPADGPFVLRGFNKWYDGLQGALVMSLQVINDSDTPRSGPVSLTFLRFNPFGVVLLDPPPGTPTSTFTFSDGDGVWSPGESSLPLTIAIAVIPEVDVSFTAELAVGFGPLSGAISGTVWRDENSDGLRDAAEPGAGGLEVHLYEGSSSQILLPTPNRVFPGSDGTFRFGGLAAGSYHLRIEPPTYLTATTPTIVDVELPAADGYVASVDSVDFGFTMLDVGAVTLPAAADATIRADFTPRTNDNHGADPYLGVGTTRELTGPTDAIRGLVRFDLAFVDRPVTAATLEMTIARFRDGSNQTYDLNLNPIVPSGDRTPWIEGNGTEVGPAPPGVEWVDAAYGVAWVGAGDGGDLNNQSQPDFDPVAAAGTLVVQSDQRSGDVIRWDVTDLVNSWRTGARPNHGVIVRDLNPEGSFRQIWFWARDALVREYPITGAQEGPRLVLEFE